MVDDNRFGVLIIRIIIMLLVMISLFSGCNNSSSDSTSGRPAGMSESDNNYVNGRFRREGLSAKDAEEATRAVNSFNQAQQQRKGR